MTSIQTTGQLPELSSALLARLSAAWGMSPDETRALWAQASDAVEAQAEQDAEEEAFQRWWDGEIVADSLTRSSTRQIAHEAWMYRASIHREEEGTIIADIEARTNNTSIEMDRVTMQRDRVTMQRDRARAEVKCLEAVVKDLDAKLQARTAEDLSNARISATDAVLRDVAAERVRQFEKWGQQRHQMRPTPTGTRPMRVGNLGIISSNFAKHDCEKAFEAGRGTFAHILVEEVAEAIDAPSLTEMRAELIQVAAVAVQMVEAIDADSPDESSHDG